MSLPTKKKGYLTSFKWNNFKPLWDTVGCLKNNYSTPTFNNIYSSSACTVIFSVFSCALEGRDYH